MKVGSLPQETKVRVQGGRCRATPSVQGSGFRVQGSGFRVQVRIVSTIIINLQLPHCSVLSSLFDLS